MDTATISTVAIIAVAGAVATSMMLLGHLRYRRAVRDFAEESRRMKEEMERLVEDIEEEVRSKSSETH